MASTLKVERWQYRLITVAFCAIALTGVLLLISLIVRYFEIGLFDENLFLRSPFQLFLAKLHGLFQYLFVWALGVFFLHLKTGLLGERKKISGLLIISGGLIAVLTGWGQYYMADSAAVRIIILIGHIAGGVLLAAGFLWHVVYARFSRIL